MSEVTDTPEASAAAEREAVIAELEARIEDEYNLSVANSTTTQWARHDANRRCLASALDTIRAGQHRGELG